MAQKKAQQAQQDAQTQHGNAHEVIELLCAEYGFTLDTSGRDYDPLTLNNLGAELGSTRNPMHIQVWDNFHKKQKRAQGIAFRCDDAMLEYLGITEKTAKRYNAEYSRKKDRTPNRFFFKDSAKFAQFTETQLRKFKRELDKERAQDAQETRAKVVDKAQQASA